MQMFGGMISISYLCAIFGHEVETCRTTNTNKNINLIKYEYDNQTYSAAGHRADAACVWGKFCRDLQ